MCLFEGNPICVCIYIFIYLFMYLNVQTQTNSITTYSLNNIAEACMIILSHMTKYRSRVFHASSTNSAAVARWDVGHQNRGALRFRPLPGETRSAKGVAKAWEWGTGTRTLKTNILNIWKE